MNSPSKPRISGSNHLMATLIIGVVCVISLAAAAWGLTNDKDTRLKVCKFVYQQMVGLHTAAQNDQGLIAQKNKKELNQGLGKAHKLLMKHCPPETDDPPPPQKPADQIKDMIKNYMIQP